MKKLFSILLILLFIFSCEDKSNEIIELETDEYKDTVISDYPKVEQSYYKDGKVFSETYSHEFRDDDFIIITYFHNGKIKEEFHKEGDRTKHIEYYGNGSISRISDIVKENDEYKSFEIIEYHPDGSIRKTY